MTQCAHQAGNATLDDAIEYNQQQAVIDSINGKIVPLYDSILKNKEDNGEYLISSKKCAEPKSI